MEPIPFFTGKQKSTDSPVAVTAGTAPSSFSASQQNAKNRQWSLSTTDPALMPANPYRCSVHIDNMAGGATAIVKLHDGTDTPPSEFVYSVPTNTAVILSVDRGEIGKGNMSVTLDSAAGTTTVTESSYE